MTFLGLGGNASSPRKLPTVVSWGWTWVAVAVLSLWRQRQALELPDAILKASPAFNCETSGRDSSRNATNLAQEWEQLKSTETSSHWAPNRQTNIAIFTSYNRRLIKICTYNSNISIYNFPLILQQTWLLKTIVIWLIYVFYFENYIPRLDLNLKHICLRDTLNPAAVVRSVIFGRLPVRRFIPIISWLILIETVYFRCSYYLYFYNGNLIPFSPVEIVIERLLLSVLKQANLDIIIAGIALHYVIF